MKVLNDNMGTNDYINLDIFNLFFIEWYLFWNFFLGIFKKKLKRELLLLDINFLNFFSYCSWIFKGWFGGTNRSVFERARIVCMFNNEYNTEIIIILMVLCDINQFRTLICSWYWISAKINHWLFVQKLNNFKVIA